MVSRAQNDLLCTVQSESVLCSAHLRNESDVMELTLQNFSSLRFVGVTMEVLEEGEPGSVHIEQEL